MNPTAPQGSNTRNYEQSMGVWLNEPLLTTSERITTVVGELADAGYGVIRVFLRNSQYTHRSPVVVRAVARFVAAAHARGLKVVLDCEPHSLVARDICSEFPGSTGSYLVRVTASVVEGTFALHARVPNDRNGFTPTFEKIEAAFVRDGRGVRKIDLDPSINAETHWYDDGHLHREMFFREGTRLDPHQAMTFQGRIDGTGSELIVYLRFSARHLVDFWAPEFESYYDGLLEKYREIPLDGVGWDEPAVDGSWNAYRYGNGFAAAFERINHYSLADKLYLLDEPGLSPESVRVRLDYYRTLNEGVAQAQAKLIAKARSLFGENLLLGTHHTWQGEGASNDYRAGAVDYFRLNDSMDAGYTDCSWWDPASVAYAYTLASSLARLTPSGEAEVNTWHFKPTVASLRSNVNLMSLMNITWFNIWYGGGYDCIQQEKHYTWPNTVEATRQHRNHQRAIGQRKPVADVAIWHGWEGVCGWNRYPLANCHKAFCLNTSLLFIQRNISADFIDSRLLAESRIAEDRLINRLGSYSVLVLPYAMVLPRSTWKVCQAFARSGGRVVFVGTPVSSDEHGESLAGEFADLLGMPAMSAEQYMSGLEAACTLPNYRPQRLEVCRPLPADLPGGLISSEGERHGVISAEGNTIFLTDLDPQQRLIDRIEDKLSPEVQAFGDHLRWRLYNGAEGKLLVAVAADDRPLRGIIRWQGKLIELTGGSVALLCIRDGNLECQGDAQWQLL